jgi:microcin C transport system permease protein
MTEAATQAAVIEAPRNRFLSPLNRRRWDNFKRNRRGWWSLWIFLVLFVATLGSEFIANDKPILAYYKGELLFPSVVDYPEPKFGGFLAVTNYRDDFIASEISANGWAVWPPIRFNYTTVDGFLPHSGAVAPSWTMTRDENCSRYPLLAEDPNCHWGNYHWLGHRRSGRDVWRACSTASASRCCSASSSPSLSSIIGVGRRRRAGLFRRLDRPAGPALHRNLDLDPLALSAC